VKGSYPEVVIEQQTSGVVQDNKGSQDPSNGSSEPAEGHNGLQEPPLSATEDEVDALFSSYGVRSMDD
jgi:hypothetical protein